MNGTRKYPRKGTAQTPPTSLTTIVPGDLLIGDTHYARRSWIARKAMRNGRPYVADKEKLLTPDEMIAKIRERS